MENTVQASASKMLPKIGMLVGILIIGGSLLGGITLAAVFGGTAAEPSSTAPVSDHATNNGQSAADPAPTAESTEDAASQPAAPQPRTYPPTPDSVPTCWDGSLPGERPDGIEKCEDHPSDD